MGVAVGLRVPTQNQALQNQKSFLLSQLGKPKPEVQVPQLPGKGGGECEKPRLTDGSGLELRGHVGILWLGEPGFPIPLLPPPGPRDPHLWDTTKSVSEKHQV